MHDKSSEATDQDERADVSDPKRQEKLTQLVLRRSKLSDDEAVLLRRIFPAIYAAHYDLVRNRLRKRGLESHDADDLSQEVFLDLHNYIVEKGFPDAIPAMLHRFTDGKFSNFLRVRGRAPLSVALPSSSSEKPASGPDVDRAIDVRDVTLHTFPQLSLEHQEILETVIVDGLSHGDAAEVLGLPVGTVKSRLMAAKRALLALAEPLVPSSQRGPS